MLSECFERTKVLDKQAILRSYSQPDEKLLLAKVLDQADLSLKKHIVCFTDFLDPAMCAKSCTMLKGIRDLGFLAFGGYEEAERKMIAMYPDYMDAEDIVFPMAAVTISYVSRFSSELSHRDYLGSVLGMGIERSRVGDIAVLEGSAVCFVKEDIADYIVSGLERVGHTKVKIKRTDISEVKLPEKKMDIKNVTVSSLRADTVFGAVFQKSRSETQELIKGEKASINWTEVKSVSDTVKDGDILSLKGSGRGKLIEVGGTTKKGRLVITVGRYV